MDIRLIVVVQNPRISLDHFLSLAVEVGPVLEAYCGAELDGSVPLVSMASMIYKYRNHAYLFCDTLAFQRYKVMIRTAK